MLSKETTPLNPWFRISFNRREYRMTSSSCLPYFDCCCKEYCYFDLNIYFQESIAVNKLCLERLASSLSKELNGVYGGGQIIGVIRERVSRKGNESPLPADNRYSLYFNNLSTASRGYLTESEINHIQAYLRQQKELILEDTAAEIV